MSASPSPPAAPPAARSGLAPALVDRLHWLDRLLGWAIRLTRHTYGALADDAYRGLYIPDAEADLLSAGEPLPPPDLLEERRVLAAQRLSGQPAPTDQPEPLARLAALFGLGRFECDLLLLTLAPELDLRYERLYAYLQDDVTRKRPTVDLALRLLCLDRDEMLAARGALEVTAPLRRHHLISLSDDGQRQPPLLGQTLKLDDRIVAELCGQPTIDARLSAYVDLRPPARSLDALILPTELRAQLCQLLMTQAGGLVLALQGGYGSGRSALAAALAAERDLPLLVVDLEALSRSELEPTEAARRLVREARLQSAALLGRGADGLLHDEALGAWRAALLAALDAHLGLTVLAIEQPWEARGALPHTRFLRLELPVTAYSDRQRLWHTALADPALTPTTLAHLASTFRLSPGQIRDAAALARSLAAWHDRPLGPADLFAAARAQSSGRLASLAHPIRPTYAWADLVLPVDQLAQLREICLQVRHRQTVLETWGFDRHLAMGKGLNVLFAGPSGTGKTMAAEIIAADLGLELAKVDLSSLVSKYIGETEKNLDRIFRAAREANAILFFDEADAIFGKRSEVKDAHDRYANIEVGYLLQKMEEYDGIVILATNLRKNLDDAFLRRLHLAIDFPFPEEPDRRRIWQRVFPPGAPLADDVDLAFCARQLKLAGGNIRNVALLAAFLAAEEGGSIAMRHLIRAAKREYQKLGKLVTEADFGPYFPLTRVESSH